MTYLIMQIRPVSLLGSNLLLSTVFRITFNICSSLQWEARVHIHKRQR